jgi:hypothetical protein
MILRELSDLRFPIGIDVVAAVDTIKVLGGRHTHDSGHQEGPTWIYTFRQFQEAQVALRINRDKLSIYVRATPHGRRDFEPALAQWAEVEQTYPNPDEKPANSLLSDSHAAFLTPSRGRLLRLHVFEGQLRPLLQAYLPSRVPTNSDVPSLSALAAPDATAPSGTPPERGEPKAQADVTSAGRRQVSAEELQRALDRNDATGRAGEQLAYDDELARLAKLGCPDVVAHVRWVANENVAAGYDIESKWNGERRCIEVKSTASGRNQLFITANECETLRALGADAWLYRVDLSAGEGGAVTMRLQDPMASLAPACFQPVVWCVDLGALCGDGA